MTGYSFDCGLEANIAGGSVGLAVRNLGPDPRGDQGCYRLPAEIAGGIQRRFGRSTLSVTGTMDRDHDLGLNGGGRWDATAALAFFAGLSHRAADSSNDIRPAAGVEVAVGSLGFAYSYAAAADGAGAHHLSLSLAARECARPAAQGGARIQHRTWAVWGGTHRSRESAEAEARALGSQHVENATIVPDAEGTFRVRIAAHLDETAAESLARQFGATPSPE